VQRVSVVGNSGSGKTTFTRTLSRAMGAPQLELDSVFHQPGWVPLPDQDFRARVAAFVAADSWVVDGNYSKVQDLVWARADTVIWIDPPRRTVMRRVIWRTLRRIASRAELWNGNTEPWTTLWRLDPEKSIIAWSWTNYRRYQDIYARARADPANAHLRFIRLRTPAEMALLMSTVPEPRTA
jgi:adenylate kinase family enzyme